MILKAFVQSRMKKMFFVFVAPSVGTTHAHVFGCGWFQLLRIEAELRESLRLDEERQQEAHFLRQQENQALRTNLVYLNLSQRLTK